MSVHLGIVVVSVGLCAFSPNTWLPGVEQTQPFQWQEWALGRHISMHFLHSWSTFPAFLLSGPPATLTPSILTAIVLTSCCSLSLVSLQMWPPCLFPSPTARAGSCALRSLWMTHLLVARDFFPTRLHTRVLMATVSIHLFNILYWVPKRQALCWELWKQLDKDEALVLKELSLHVLDEPVLRKCFLKNAEGVPPFLCLFPLNSKPWTWCDFLKSRLP